MRLALDRQLEDHPRRVPDTSGVAGDSVVEDWQRVLSDALRAFVMAAGDLPLLAALVAERVAEVVQSPCVVGYFEDRAAWGACVACEPGERAQRAAADLSERLAALPLVRDALELERSSLPAATLEQIAGGVGSRSACVLVHFAGTPLGAISVGREDSGLPLSQLQVRLLLALSERAAVARHHGLVLASAHREVKERQRLAERLHMLARASGAFAAASGNYRAILDTVARTVGEMLGELCSIRLVSGDGEWLLAEDSSVYHANDSVAEHFRRAMKDAPQRVGHGVGGQVVATGHPYFNPRVDLEQLRLQTQGSYRPLMQHVEVASLVVVPLMSQGRCLGILSISRDSSCRPYDEDDLALLQELAERASLAVQNAALLRDLEHRIVQVQKAKEKFRQLLESAPDAILIVDERGHIALINARTEHLFGYSRSELLGHSVETLLPDEYRARHPALRDAYYAAPRVRHAMAPEVELYGQRKDGSRFPAEINLSPIETSDGAFVTAVVRDLTERKRLEFERARARELETLSRRAEEASRLKSEFLANMSHELRTPLNAIIGFSALLHAGKAGALSDVQTEYLGDILTSSRHLLQLINDVLDLAKIEAGKVELKPAPVDLSQLVGEVRDTLRGVALDKSLQLVTDVEPSLTEVVTDPRLLKQVLYNYLSNAIKFSNEAGQIAVTARAGPEGYFTVAVTDQGIGIDSQDLPRLFHQFEQLDSGASKRYPGSGLGLALTKRIVEAQGGSVSVESEPGRGTTFSATLPLKPPSATPPRTP
jgi:PAS domain S-box-containing protein